MVPELVVAGEEHKTLLQNLMQFYIYDFSEFIDLDVNMSGLYDPYKELQLYFEEKKQRFAYLIKEKDKYIGFVLIRVINAKPKPHFSVAEFFIMKKYRRKGRGKAIAIEIFNLHRGDWEVYQQQNNRPAFMFWKKTIGEYTSGHFSERVQDGKTIQILNSYHFD